jgi:hypothetical protein
MSNQNPSSTITQIRTHFLKLYTTNKSSKNIVNEEFSKIVTKIKGKITMEMDSVCIQRKSRLPLSLDLVSSRTKYLYPNHNLNHNLNHIDKTSKQTYKEKYLLYKAKYLALKNKNTK